MPAPKPLLYGVELGGTKCVCLAGTAPEDIRGEITIPTGDPNTTLTQIRSVLDGWNEQLGPAAAIGIASFGPIDLRAGSSGFGRILSSAKPGWQGANVFGSLNSPGRVPAALNTDVNAAALAEGRWGAARQLADFAYVTVGTGVGVGLVVGSRLAGGFNHPELGHIRVARYREDNWSGACPFHGDCVEGLASGTAIRARTGVTSELLKAADPVWRLVAHPLAQLFHLLVMATAPRRILVGGGVATGRPELLPLIRDFLTESVNRYLDLADFVGDLDEFITAPALGPRAGPLGALALASDALESSVGGSRPGHNTADQ